MNYKKLNSIIGWLVFAIAAFTYCMTIEPTASFWDCSEFITTGYKMEVGHPPGAPIFMLTANLFSQFTSDPGKVSMMVNLMSALLSALCILFLFWTITILVKKLVSGSKEPDFWQKTVIFGSAIVGSLAYTWSDTFWFSAVEGEVYAYSSFCTAVTFWLILKWEEQADMPHSSRWIVLLAYLIGVSVGVHLLNLLCITAIVLVYYFKKTENPNFKGGLLAFCLSGVIIALVLYGIVPGIVKVGGWFELLFVNGLGLPFNTGLMVYIILLAATIVWSVYETQRADRKALMNISFLLTTAMVGLPFLGHTASSIILGILLLSAGAFYLFSKIIPEKAKPAPYILNTIMVCIMMITIGYSSYAVIVIRSSANPPMDENSPNDIFTLGEYLAREQYGSRPLLYGQCYDSDYLGYEVVDDKYQPISKIVGKKRVRKVKSSPGEKDSYLSFDKTEPLYKQNMLFPRMYSPVGEHIRQYNSWVGGIQGRSYVYKDETGETKKVTVPTQLENLKFFFRYQVNHMYWRYFLWNFAGRQNDIQNRSGEIDYGNWITGFRFIDRKLIGGDTRLLPESLAGKGHNVFYCLPLILGILGLIWQIGKGKKGTQQFFVVLTLFFMTGLAIVIYLNQTPSQPRERDYAYAGSFYAFAIWIGMGVAALSEILGRIAGKKIAPVAASVICLLVPVQMVSQTWDDHDRSNRYTCRDFGQNYLISLEEGNNPIIFTNGDNDTFPLWYNFETEGFRTDARCCNLSYLNTDWYTDQMKRPAYDSPALPISFTRDQYTAGGVLDDGYVMVNPRNEKADLIKQIGREKADKLFELKTVMEFIKQYRIIPTDTIWFEIDKDAVLRSGMKIPSQYLGATDEETKSKMPDRMVISLKNKKVLYRNEIVMLDLIAQCNWERPLYIATSVGSDSWNNLQNYFLAEGLAYRITPFNWTKLGGHYNNGDLDSDKMYENLMNFKFTGLDQPGIYLDETIRRMCLSHRLWYIKLAERLYMEGKKDKALNILEKIDNAICEDNLPLNDAIYDEPFMYAQLFMVLGNKERASEIVVNTCENHIKQMEWLYSMDTKHYLNSIFNLDVYRKMFNEDILKLMAGCVDKETFDELVGELSMWLTRLQHKEKNI